MIVAENLTKFFNKQPALDKVNLTVSRGERAILVGRNGSGKTTFIRCLLGLYSFGGMLRIDGLEPRKDRTAILRRIGYVPQTPPPVNMKAIELMRYAADLSDRPVGPILEVAHALHLNSGVDLRKNFQKLSGGMKQKVMIAIAIARGNDTIIMDEPTSNLDPDSRKVFYDLLSGCTRDTTVILTSHRSDELQSFTNRTIEMDYGKVVWDSAAGASG